MAYLYDYRWKPFVYGKKYDLQINPKTPGWNDEIDAFRHCFSQALISLKFNENFSEKFGTIYEMKNQIFDKQKPDERNMDQWNNAIGREIAKEFQMEMKDKKYSTSEIEDIIAEKIIRRIKNGDLITNPNDERRYNERSFKERIFNLKNRIFHKNELTMNDINSKEMLNIFLDQALEKRGLPTKEELDKKVAAGKLIYVNNYERSDGTKVSGYYRSYPNY